MITVKLFVDSDGQYRGFRVTGHAEYGEPGEDIVCAGVSVLTQNTVNAIDVYTEDDFTCTVDDGYLECVFSEKISPESKLLLNTMVLGLESIMESCRTEKKKNQFLNISTEAV